MMQAAGYTVPNTNHHRHHQEIVNRDPRRHVRAFA